MSHGCDAFCEAMISDVSEALRTELWKAGMHNNPGPQLEPQEVASVAALGIHFGLVELADVVGWADSIIIDHDQPPYWAIELALAKPSNVQELLQRIPGERDKGLCQAAFLAVVRHFWKAGRLSIHDLRVVGRMLYAMDHESMVWGIIFDDEFEAFEAGRLIETDLRTALTEHLMPFALFEPLVPEWLLRPRTKRDDGKGKPRLYRTAYDAAHDIMTHEWDPIGVGGEPMAQDEYNSYIPGALHMIVDGQTDAEIARYLREIETDQMGMSPHDGMTERHLRIARRLREALKPFLGR